MGAAPSWLTRALGPWWQLPREGLGAGAVRGSSRRQGPAQLRNGLCPGSPTLANFLALTRSPAWSKPCTPTPIRPWELPQAEFQTWL